jgi:hypothetical protein
MLKLFICILVIVAYTQACVQIGICPACEASWCNHQGQNYPQSTNVGGSILVPSGSNWNCLGMGCQLGSNIIIKYAWVNIVLGTGSYVSCVYDTKYKVTKSFEFINCYDNAQPVNGVLPSNPNSFTVGYSIHNAVNATVFDDVVSGNCVGVHLIPSCS